jgi:histidinol-phosphate aminotransferase
MNIEKLVRPNILAMKAYSSARDEYDKVGAVILLDANENPYPTDWNRYPDPYQKELKKVIAKTKGVDIDQLFLGNGSDEGIDLLFRIFCEPGVDNVIIPDPTYGMYEVAAAIQNVEVRKVTMTPDFQLDVDKILAKSNKNTKLIFLCNPNNPTGNLLDSNSIDRILKEFNGIVIIDEAYIDFANEESSIRRLKEHNNLIILQTFSKAWGLAGLRIGMAYAGTEIIRLLNKVKPPYNLNILTQNTTREIVSKGIEKVNAVIDTIIKERNRLTEVLKTCTQVDKIHASDSNFLLVKFKDHKLVFDQLISNNLIVRDRSKAVNCDNCLRITVGTKEENDLLLKTINAL